MVFVASTVQGKRNKQSKKKKLHCCPSQEGRSRYLITSDTLKLEHVPAISSP